MTRALSLEMALAILAAHGVEPDRAALAGFAERRGWTVTTEASGRPATRRRWRAAVFVTRPWSAANRTLLSGATGRGPTEAEALALAVANMLQREGRWTPTARIPR